MSVIVFLIIIAAVVFALVLGAVVVSALPSIGVRSNRELKAVKYQLRSAERSLRTIANGSAGNPVLEAQLALDEIDRKELES